MDDPQIWTLIAAFSVALIGIPGMMAALINRTIRAEVGGLRASMTAKFDAVDARFDAVTARFDTVDTKIGHLDRDVQALTRHVFGTDPRA
jgi:hypothetical protein